MDGWIDLLIRICCPYLSRLCRNPVNSAADFRNFFSAATENIILLLSFNVSGVHNQMCVCAMWYDWKLQKKWWQGAFGLYHVNLLFLHVKQIV